MTRRRIAATLCGAAVVLALGVTSTSWSTGGPPRHHNHHRTQLHTDDVVDGQLLFNRFDEHLQDDVVLTVNPDGTQARQVYDGPMECPRWSPDGTKIASCGTPQGAGATILDVDSGVAHYYPVLPGHFSPFSTCSVWAPNQHRLACDAAKIDDPSSNGIWTVRVPAWNGVRRVTTNPGGDDVPGSYSPDGQQIVYASYTADPGNGGESIGLFDTRLDGTHKRLLSSPGVFVGSPGDWSADGRWIVFSQHTTLDARSSIWLVHPNGTGLHELHLSTALPCGGPFSDPESVGCFNPVFSPSGQSIAFIYNNPETGAALWTVELATGRLQHVADATADEIDWSMHPLVH